MPQEDTELRTPPIELGEHRIELEDGRYMVFFTFTAQDGRDLSEGLHPWNEEGRDNV